jgi:hypothetical protein
MLTFMQSPYVGGPNMLAKFTALFQNRPNSLQWPDTDLCLLPAKMSKRLWVNPAQFLTLDHALALAEWALSITQSGRLALQSVATNEMTQLANGYAIAPTTSAYGGVKQRWLIVYSEQAAQRDLKQLNKRVARATTKAEKVLKTLNNQAFACEKDARQAVDKVVKKLKWHTLSVTYQPIKKYSQPGRPPKGARRHIVGWQCPHVVSCRRNSCLTAVSPPQPDSQPVTTPQSFSS